MNIRKTALITGITGQDGSYLAEFLLSKGYVVHGLSRKSLQIETKSKNMGSAQNITVHHGDLSDDKLIKTLITEIMPDEVYNLAAQSHVGSSFTCPAYTGNITGLGTARLLEAILKSGKNIKFYQASSSEMFGLTPPPQNESTLLHPRSPYACAKVYAHYLTQNYRESYNTFACSGILFNHESPRRGEDFVTRKITQGVASIIAGKQNEIIMGNLDVKRDWGYAPEYVQIMWTMLQQDTPDDYAIGTGNSHYIREFVENAFEYADLNWEKYIHFDKTLFRPSEVDNVIADTRKATKILGWNPKITFQDLIKIMVDADMRNIGLEPIGEGDQKITQHFPNRWWVFD